MAGWSARHRKTAVLGWLAMVAVVFVAGHMIGGISSSAGVVTSAALIMVAVFSILATLSVIQLKMLGVGLSAAVLIDATVVRGILVPSALALLGERSWYLPRWLAWLPGRAPGRAVTQPSAQDAVIAPVGA
jgi:RND superfamily putative drug exporter